MKKQCTPCIPKDVGGVLSVNRRYGILRLYYRLQRICNIFKDTAYQSLPFSKGEVARRRRVGRDSTALPLATACTIPQSASLERPQAPYKRATGRSPALGRVADSSLYAREPGRSRASDYRKCSVSMEVSSEFATFFGRIMARATHYCPFGAIHLVSAPTVWPDR